MANRRGINKFGRTVSAMNPELWKEKVHSGGTGLVKDIKTPQEDIPFEFMLNVLRLREGVNNRTFGKKELSSLMHPFGPP